MSGTFPLTPAPSAIKIQSYHPIRSDHPALRAIGTRVLAAKALEVYVKSNRQPIRF